MNATAVADGIVATVSATISGAASAAFGLTDVLSADPDGNGIATTATGGSVVITPSTVSGVACNPTALAPGATSTCTATITGAAGSGESAVTIGTTGSVSAPASITIAGGVSTGTFTITAGQFSSDQSATVTASLNGTSKSANLSLSAAVLLSSLGCTATTLTSNSSTTCTITSTKAAPTGGVSVTLSGGISGILTVPASATIAAGATTTIFLATTASLSSDQTVTLTASLNGSSKTATVALVAPAAPVLVSSLSCPATTLTSNSSASCTITSTKAAPSGGVSVTLSGGIAGVLTVPTSATIAAGATTTTFPATAASVASDQTATLTASLNGSSKTATVALAAPALLSSLSCTATTLASNSNATCTIKLTKAPPSAITVPVSGAITNILTVPTSITFAAASSTATFTVTSGVIATPQNTTVTASYGGSTVNATLSLVTAISAPMLSSLTCSATSLRGGQSGTCQVSLASTALSAQLVSLKSSVAALSVPANVTVSAGSSSASFAFTTTTDAKGWLVITATLGTTSKSVVIIVTSQLTSAAAVAVSCPQSAAPSGTAAICSVSLSSPNPEPTAVHIFSSSNHVAVPSEITIPAGRSAARFKTLVSNRAPSGTTVITATAGERTAETHLPVESSTAPEITTAGSTDLTPGLLAGLKVSFGNDAWLLSVGRAPKGGKFDASTGEFLWRPEASDIGDHEVRFQARDRFGVSSASITLHVGSGTPEIEALENLAGGPGACTPGSVAALTGHFLTPANGDDEAHVLVNDSPADVVAASSRRVDFLCPVISPGATLSISVRTSQGVSNSLTTVMQTDAPVILTAPASGDAVAMHATSGQAVGLPAPNVNAAPAIAGEQISILATGVSCDATFPNGRMAAEIGGVQVPVRGIERAEGRVGLCQVTFGTPIGITGDSLMMRLLVGHYDGSTGASAPAAITIEND